MKRYLWGLVLGILAFLGAQFTMVFRFPGREVVFGVLDLVGFLALAGVFLFIRRRDSEGRLLENYLGDQVQALDASKKSGLKTQAAQNAENLVRSIEERLLQFQKDAESLQQEIKTVQTQRDAATQTVQTIRSVLDDFHRLASDLLAQLNVLQNQAMETMGFNQTLVVEMAGQELETTMASATMSGIVSSIQDIDQMARDKITAIGALREIAYAGQKQMEASKNASAQILQSTEAIQKAASMIQKIAAQSSMLAMNAAIEAAHAGDSGLGFAVVAQEIRKLSEDTSVSSREISATIKKTVEVIRSAEGATNLATSSFTKLIAGVQEFSEQVETLKTALAGLAGQTSGATSSIGIITKSMAEIKKSSLEMNSKNIALVMGLNQVAEISKQVDGDSLKVHEAVDELGKSWDSPSTST
jgi:methyl-accepting chemotaxis protein